VGGDQLVRVDVRVIVATHRDLEELVRREKFRQDLFHRIYVFPLRLPPLRERAEDIPTLVAHFARQFETQNAWKPVHIAPDALEALTRYSWPGNVRELRNVVERLLLLASEDGVTQSAVESLLAASTRSAPAEGPCGTLAERVAAFERATILRELERNEHHMTRTAKALGLERSYLYKKCQQLDINLRGRRSEE
jgi:two-component system nitrogen regulation response regulator NtrX